MKNELFLGPPPNDLSPSLVSQPHDHLDSIKTSYLKTTNSLLLCDESKLALHQDHL
jgi:hypothetical protein